MTDRTETLLRRAQGGDAGAVEALIAHHLPGLTGWVRLRMGPVLSGRESASDLAQSACREALQQAAGFRYTGETAFRRWLYTTALNKIRQHARYHGAERRTPRREVQSPGVREETEAPGLLDAYATFCTPSRVAMEREEVSRIESAFAQLSDDYQEVILLARFLGLSHAEIATEMNRTPEAARVLLHRALARLATLLT